jgi:hypothetical protein
MEAESRRGLGRVESDVPLVARSGRRPRRVPPHLLALLGHDDPADVQATTVDAYRSLVEEAGHDARSRPAPAEWSVVECLAHATDAEIVMSVRYRWILAHDEPPLIGYDQDLWVDRLHGPVEPAHDLLSVFGPLRTANIALWCRTSEERRGRVGLHAERGPRATTCRSA